MTIGSDIANKTFKTLSEIVTKIQTTADNINDINQASNEQDTQFTHLVQSLSGIEEIVQLNAATAEESAATAEELNAQSYSMLDIVSKVGAMVGIAKDGSLLER